MNLNTALLCLVVLVSGSLAIAQTPLPPTVPGPLYFQYPRVDHAAYEFLERLETRASGPLFSNTRPFLHLQRHPGKVRESGVLSRETQRFLAEGRANLRAIGRTPAGDDVAHPGWTRLRRQFGLSPAQTVWFYGDGFHFARAAFDTTFTVTLQPVYGLELIDTDDERGGIGRAASGLRVDGGYAGRLHYLMDFRDHNETGNGPYDSRAKLYEDRWAAVGLSPDRMSTSYDISESFVQYYGRDLSLAVGRGKHRWGPARAGSLFLNSRMPPFDYARFDASLESQSSARAVYYTFLHGSLESQAVADTLYVSPTGRARTVNAQKYLSAQRLEVRPRDNLLVGFSQGVVYGDRGVQLGYLTPLNFLYSVQHSNDDKDNMVLGFDGTWRPVAGVKLYGELFLDDVVVSELLSASGNNKSAFTAGTEFGRQVSRRLDLDLWFEYTRIRPSVYSHVFATNVYTHWTSPIGYSLEPNSEYVTSELRGTYYPFALTFTVRHGNHGANPAGSNVGGDIHVPIPDLEKNRDYPLLSGNLQRTLQLGVGVEWEALPDLRLFSRATSISATGKPDRLEAAGGFAWNL